MLSAAQRIERWRNEGPALFAAEAMQAEPTEQQWDGGTAIATRRKVSIRSGHGTGKSALDAWTVLWGLTCFPDVKIPCTAPTAHQLDDVLWAELSFWHWRMPELLRAQIAVSAERAVRIDRPQSAFAVPRTARPEQPEALQGFHAETLILIVDEASGVPDAVFQVGEGALTTPGVYALLNGNPTRMQGYFFDTHHSQRANWATLAWNGEDSPLVSREYIRTMAEKYGEDSAIYRIRVKGEFAGSPDGVIALELIEAAIGRDVERSGNPRWGLDVARFGEDRTALAKRCGNVLLEKIKSWSGKDTMQTAGMVALEYEETPEDMKPEAICVDVIGLGAGVVDRMRELDVPVIAVNVAETPSVRNQYNRLRDELWFEAREWFYRRDCTMPDDQDLVAELTLPAFRVLSNGKKQVQSKDDMKKIGVQSPDLADAFCLTFARGTTLRRPRERERGPTINVSRYMDTESSGTWMGA